MLQHACWCCARAAAVEIQACSSSCCVSACVLQLQAFFLVADDIMDGSITRRGQPCWYKVPKVRPYRHAAGLLMVVIVLGIRARVLLTIHPKPNSAKGEQHRAPCRRWMIGTLRSCYSSQACTCVHTCSTGLCSCSQHRHSSIAHLKTWLYMYMTQHGARSRAA